MKKLTNISFFILATLLFSFSACKTTTDTVTQFTSGPVGATTNLKTGTIARQNSPGTPDTKGTLAIVQDSQNNQFIKLNSDFASGFSTGTVAVYLAKDMTEIKTQRTASASNILAAGFVNKNGEQYLKISNVSGFDFVVFYCETAEVNFGAAPLK